MIDGKSLWADRCHNYWREAQGYLKLILNSGFVGSVFFLFLFLTVYYQQFIETMPADFPVAELLTVLFAWRLTAGHIRTFVKPADIVFLLPYEDRLRPYFARSIAYSIAWQSSYIVLMFMASGPMFTARGGGGAVFWVTLVLLLAVKAWNMLAVWYEQRLTSRGERASHIVLRLLLNTAAAYLLFDQAPYWLTLALLLLMALLYVFYFRMLKTKHVLKWDRLIEIESGMVLFFYRIANAFTDVPQLRKKVRARTYMQWAIPLLGGDKRAVYQYLYARSFIRANDYFGTYVRLLLVGSLILYILPSGWMQVGVAFLFTHMTMMQLSTLSFHHATSMWVDLYPIRPGEQKTAMSQLVLRLLAVLVLAFALIVWASTSVIFGLLTLVATGALAFYGSQTLIHRKRGKYRRIR
jgi:ABC-2 type transport system permease protein